MIAIGYFCADFGASCNTVDITVGDHKLDFFISNIDDVPPNIKQEFESGDRVAGAFEFDPHDQFATYIPVDRLAIKPKEPTEEEMAEAKERWYTCNDSSICNLSVNGRCTGEPIEDCPE